MSAVNQANNAVHEGALTRSQQPTNLGRPHRLPLADACLSPAAGSAGCHAAARLRCSCGVGAKQAQLPFAVEIQTEDKVVVLAAPCRTSFAEWLAKLRTCCPDATFASCPSVQERESPPEEGSANDQTRTSSPQTGKRKSKAERWLASEEEPDRLRVYGRQREIRDAYMASYKATEGIRQPPLRCILRAPLAAHLGALHRPPCRLPAACFGWHLASRRRGSLDKLSSGRL